ncbi:MAG: indolepyruvate ferredoxin oxidoreductase subunit alpha [Spirochaetes bacterium]|nr:indolepyruvate ferredoxin oxidoreductase subunit alpha [Spirochaetota bacterium]
MKRLLTGNEAIARGVFEAGVSFGSAYPGTPSTEIFENLASYKGSLYCEWAPNEKVAVEVAYGASIAGLRSISAMKHVGLNVAADPIFSATYQGVGAGFVVVSADDPDMHSSQNEQDNRLYAKFAKMALVEPSDSQECLDFIKEAYRISEKFDTLVLFRVTTRVSHSKSLVEEGERIEASPREYVKNVEKFVSTPEHAKINHGRLEAKMKELAAYAETSPLNRLELKGSKIGVISAAISYQYAREVFPEDTSFLKLGFTYPLPMGLIRDFALKVEKLYVIEELEPFMEEQIKMAGIPCVGKSLVPSIRELDPAILAKALFGVEPETAEPEMKPTNRPPALCPGCPHRGFFYALSKGRDYVIAGDIGCYSLGYHSPLNAMDTCLCMGGGFSVGMGMAKAFEISGRSDKKVFGLVGDSTFFHSGMTGATEIIYNSGRMIPCVLDNRITGMTGHQDNPGTGETLLGLPAPQIDIARVLSALGFDPVFTVDPLDLKAVEVALNAAQASAKPAAIVARSPCVLVKKLARPRKPYAVDPAKCRSCKRCLKVGCPAFSFDRISSIDPALCAGCSICAQVCPFGAISQVGGP